MFGDPITLMASVMVLLGSGYFLYMQGKKMKDSGLNASDYINEVLLEGHLLWVLILIFIVSIAESLLAASIHPGGQQQINVAARFVAHFAINMGGTIMNIMLAQLVVQFLVSLNFIMDTKKSQDVRYYLLTIIRLTNILWVGFCAMYIPYFNYMTIAQGLGELQNAKWAVRELFGQNLTLIYQAHELGADYKALANLSYIMFASLGAMIVHYMLALYDGFSAVEKRLERELNNPGQLKPGFQEDVRRYTRNPSEGIRYLITMAGNQRDKADINTIVNSIVASYANLSIQKRSKIAINLGRIVSRWKSIEAEERGGTANTSKRAALTSETKDFFRKSHTDGGLDRALSNRRQP